MGNGDPKTQRGNGEGAQGEGNGAKGKWRGSQRQQREGGHGGEFGDPRGQGGLKGEQTPKPAENLEGSQRGLGGGSQGH